jgi:hypothetical protein
MCGKEGARESLDTPDSWDDFDTFCPTNKPCIDRFANYIDSKNTDLTHGCPDIYSRDHFERHKRDVVEPIKGVGVVGGEVTNPLTCSQCGKRHAKVVRNYGMYVKYRHKDFCMNNKCCKAYTDYVAHLEYLEKMKDLKKPYVLMK